MNTRIEEVHDLKVRLFLAAITLCGMIVLAAAAPRGSGASTSAPTPRVTSITQLTHDGVRKSNLLADNSGIYITESPSENRVIAKVTLSGATRSVIPSPFVSLEALDLSPDQSRLLVSARRRYFVEHEFWTMPVNSGSPQRVGDLQGRDGSWSADGKQLVFADSTTLSVANADGTQVHKIYDASGAVFAPRFSPDGKRIRFTVGDAEQGTTSLWEVASDGSNPHALLGGWAHSSTACCGTWTADGRYYIFQANETLPNTTMVMTSLWTLAEFTDPASTAPTALTHGLMSFGNPSVSHDSQKIWAIGVWPQAEIVRYEPKKEKFVPVLPGVSATDLNYSSDGKWVAYVSIPEGTLWRARVNGEDRMQLTSEPDRAALPRWSPDGKQIAFVSMKPGQSWRISLVSSSGGIPQEILQENGSQIDANWSADGSRLIFGDFAHDAGGLSIRVLDFKTHEASTIPGSQGLFSPRWSPNERYIAALSPDNSALMIFDFQTQKWSKWLTSPGAVNYPVWSADSQYLYYDDLVDGAETIRRVKLGATEAERVFEVGTMDRFLGPLGPWTGQAPDGAWLFVRDRSTQEAYQLNVELPVIQ